MGQNNKEVCKSDRCCCQLISKCEEKPAIATPRQRNVSGVCEERPDMSICDFLKSQPTPEWINSGRGNRPEANDSKDRQRDPCGQPPPASNCSGKNRTTYVHRPKPQPEWVRSTEQICVPKDGGMRQSQHRHRSDQRSQPSICDTEDRQLSQIIINFGTVVTSEKCKSDDSCQQTSSEVQDVHLEKKRRASTRTNRPPPDRSTCSPRAPADRSTSTCPSTERSTSTSPPAERSTSTRPPDRSSRSRTPADRPIPSCPPPERSSCTRGPDRSTSTCPPPDRSSCTRASVDHPIPTGPPPNRSTCSTRAPADRSTSTGPPDCSSCTRAPADRSTSTSPPDCSSCTRAPADRSTSTSPPDCSSCTRASDDRPIPTYPLPESSSSTRGPAERLTSTGPPACPNCTRAPADRSTRGSRAPAYRSTSSCPLADRSSFTVPQASSTFIRPSTDRPNFTCSLADRNNRSVSTRPRADWSASTSLPVDRSNSVRPPNVRPPNVRPPNVRPYGMGSNTMGRETHSRYQDDAVSSTPQTAHSQYGIKSKTTSCYCDNNNSDF